MRRGLRYKLKPQCRCEQNLTNLCVPFLLTASRDFSKWWGTETQSRLEICRSFYFFKNKTRPSAVTQLSIPAAATCTVHSLPCRSDSCPLLFRLHLTFLEFYTCKHFNHQNQDILAPNMWTSPLGLHKQPLCRPGSQDNPNTILPEDPLKDSGWNAGRNDFPPMCVYISVI